jgi:hypothetical protein
MTEVAQTWADRVAEDMQVLGGLSDKTFTSLVREMDTLSAKELRALVDTFLAFGPEPVSETVREERLHRPRRPNPPHS